MKPLETAQMLHVFQAYWPTFDVKANEGPLPGTAAIWHKAIGEYPIETVRRAVLVFRGQKTRTFAPTLSEFEGQIREFEEESRRAEAMKAHARLNFAGRDSDPTESYQASGRNYVRATKKRRHEIHEEMTALGFKKVTFNLADGKKGYRYTR